MRHEGPRPISVLRVGMLASIATTLTPPLGNLTKADFGVEELTLHAGQSGDHEALLRSKRADLVVTSNPFYDMDGLDERQPSWPRTSTKMAGGPRRREGVARP
jgi:DNA-binding transcriptional LysR family regulator